MVIRYRTVSPIILAIVCLCVTTVITGEFGTPKGEEGARIFKAEEHPHYSGQFHLTGQKTILVGSMNDRSPWNHLDYVGKRLTPVQGTIAIDVNERTNSGQVSAQFVEGSDQYRIVFDRFASKAPFQDGGIATRIYEHGDSGNGDLPVSENVALSRRVGCRDHVQERGGSPPGL